MIAKYLFFLILLMVLLIHALRPWSRLSAASPFFGWGGGGIMEHGSVCFWNAGLWGFTRDCANISVKTKAKGAFKVTDLYPTVGDYLQRLFSFNCV